MVNEMRFSHLVYFFPFSLIQGKYSFILSLKTDKTVEHVGIHEAQEKWMTGNLWGIKFETEFIDAYNVIYHYQNHVGKWGCLLKAPCPKVEKKPKKPLIAQESFDLSTSVFPDD